MKIFKHWGSHLPVLMKVLSITEGPVLEMGMGLYSTPYLHWACFEKRELVSYDNDPKYFHMNEDYRGEGHEVSFVEDWSKIDIVKPWDVAFFDEGPAEVRAINLMKVANIAKYIVVHDTQWREDKHYHYKELVFPFFKYRYDYIKTKPHTSVLSNIVDLTNFTV